MISKHTQKRNLSKLHLIFITRFNHMATKLRRNRCQLLRSWGLWTKNNVADSKYGTRQVQPTCQTRFFTVQNNQLSSNCIISQDICTLFACYLYSTLCGWIINPDTNQFISYDNWNSGFPRVGIDGVRHCLWKRYCKGSFEHLTGFKRTKKEDLSLVTLLTG